MKTRWMYLVPGILMLTAILIATPSGLPQADQAIYEAAIAFDENHVINSFPSYSIQDYTFRFFDGTHDYVIRDRNVTKEKPFLRSLAATTVQVEGEWQVLVPTIERMNSTLSFLGKGQDLSSIDSDALQVATLWHEGFHSYQMTHFEENLAKYMNLHDMPENIESFVAEYIDADEHLKKDYLQAEQILDTAIASKNLEETKRLASEFLDVYYRRRENLTEKARQMESLYEMIEGSAQYIESLIYRAQAGEEAYQEYYMTTDTVAANGISKYYTMGRKICLVLDKLSPDWSKDFDFSVGLAELLAKNIEEER